MVIVKYSANNKLAYNINYIISFEIKCFFVCMYICLSVNIIIHKLSKLYLHVTLDILLFCLRLISFKHASDIVCLYILYEHICTYATKFIRYIEK